MRGFLLFLVVSIPLLAGCQSPKKIDAAAEPGASRTVKTEVLPPNASIRPVNAVRGRVISVREDLRFAIVDFTGGKLPKLDQQLFAYRFDQKVAELKVSGPYRGTTVAVDIAAGDTRPGDLVRDR